MPMKLNDNGYEEDGSVVSGIVGFKQHMDDKTKAPAVEAVHGWSLFLKPDSRFRNDLEAWEKSIQKRG